MGLHSPLKALGDFTASGGTRTSTLTIVNGESATSYFKVEKSTDGGSSYTPLTQTFLLQLVLQIIQHLPQRFQMVTVLRGELQVLIQVVISQALLHLRYQERLIVQYQ